MESSARTDPEGDRRDGIDDAGVPDPIERGRLTGETTSVRVQWRIDTVPRGVDSEAPPADPGSDQIALVAVRLRNPDPVEQRVSVRNALDGPVLFPRRRGVPESGWGRSGFVGAVPAKSERALGYACPASIRTPPIELGRASESRRPSGNSRDGSRSTNEGRSAVTPAAVVRTHGDAAPPAAVVRERTRVEGRESGQQASDPEAPSPEPSIAEPSGGRDDAGGDAEAIERERGSESAPPPAVTAWLDGIERRITRAERLDGASVHEATAVLTEADGLDAAVEDAERLPEAVAELRALAARAADLADRADAVAVPAEALRRLA